MSRSECGQRGSGSRPDRRVCTKSSPTVVECWLSVHSNRPWRSPARHLHPVLHLRETRVRRCGSRSRPIAEVAVCIVSAAAGAALWRPFAIAAALLLRPHHIFGVECGRRVAAARVRASPSPIAGETSCMHGIARVGIRMRRGDQSPCLRLQPHVPGRPPWPDDCSALPIARLRGGRI
jgi:hypothetical protein